MVLARCSALGRLSTLAGLPALVGLLACPPARAADASATPDATGYIVTLGAGAEFSPRYPGAKSYGLSPVPSFGIRAADEPEGFSSPRDSLDYSLVETPKFAFGPVANIRWGRTRRDMPSDMRGISTTPTMPEIGAFADYWLAPDALRTRVEVRHGLASNDGLVADVSADLVHRFGSVTISGGPRLTAASSAVMDRNFGVSNADAQLNGAVSSFRANGGVQSVGVGLTLKREITATTSITGYGQYDRLVDDAAKSPITRRFGSPNQLTFGLGLEHAFSFGN